jgi:hypothetical protein
MKRPVNRMMPHQGQGHATDMCSDLLKAIESLGILHGIGRGFHSHFKKVWVQSAAGIGDMAQRFLECRRAILKISRGALDSREARRRTRTAKLLNSNPLIDRNNRFGLLLELVKNLINHSQYCFILLSTYVVGGATSIAPTADLKYPFWISPGG